MTTVSQYNDISDYKPVLAISQCNLTDSQNNGNIFKNIDGPFAI